MMSRSFLFVWPCLLLVCCDKQGSSEIKNDEPASAPKSARSRITTREHASDTAKHLHEQLDHAETLDSAEREKALAAIAWDAIERDPKIAHEAFGKMASASPEKIRLIQHYAMRLAADNMDEALEWAEALENETEKSAALSQIAVVLAETDPKRAANLLVAADMPGRDFEVAAVQVIQRWAAQSPPDAAAWVSMFPQNPAREAGVKIIAERWLPSDTPAAFAWLSSIKDAEIRQETARAMQGVILQQPAATRTAWLQHADAQLQAELEQQREAALKEVGDNIRPEEP